VTIRIEMIIEKLLTEDRIIGINAENWKYYRAV